jgi:predicted dienelactone hydrolase
MVQESGVSSGKAPATVGMITRDFIDGSRKNWEGTGPRPLRTTIWYPAMPGSKEEILSDSDQTVASVPIAPVAEVSQESQKYPLILLSHGARGSRMGMMWLGYYLASHGYIAAAVNHLGKTGDERQLAGQFFLSDWNMWERPRDMTVVLDKLLGDVVFSSRIDQRRIGAAGFSAGGTTVIFLAGGILDLQELQTNSPLPPELREAIQVAIVEFEELKKSNAVIQESVLHSGDSYKDTRIRSVFALAPAVGGGFTKAGLRTVKVPVHIVVGQADVVTPLATNAQRFADLIEGAKLTVLPGEAGHWTGNHERVDHATVLQGVSQLAWEFFEHTLTNE